MQILYPGIKVTVKYGDGNGTIAQTVLTDNHGQLEVTYGVLLDDGGEGEYEEKDLDPLPGMKILIVDYQ
jgi:hypothetical protein